MEHLYPVPADASETRHVPRHKEEGQKWSEIDADERRKISIELSKMSHPLENQSPHLYNIVNGSFAPPESQMPDQCCRISQHFMLQFHVLSKPWKT